MFEGKGFYLYQADVVLARMGVDATEAARRAKAAGIQHVIVKIADGPDAYPFTSQDPQGKKEAATGALIAALQAAGITVGGMAFAYGSPTPVDTQAQCLANRAKHFGITNLVINPEDYKTTRWSIASGATRARQYITSLRAAMGNTSTLIGLRYYEYNRSQSTFPYAAFMEACDVALPQIYWIARGEGDAGAALQVAHQKHLDRFPTKLFIPTGATDKANGQDAQGAYTWSSSPAQIARFLTQVRALSFPAANFWSWQHAYHDNDNPRFPGTELWDAVAAFTWEHIGGGGTGGTGEGDPDVITIEVNDTNYLDGLYPDVPDAALTSFTRQNKTMKFAITRAENNSVWAMWQPDILVSGLYDISVWVPGEKATSRHARYLIHGIVGEPEPVAIEINQNRFSDQWVRLGTWKLDANNPQSGQVALTNYTPGESGRSVAFATVSWELATSTSLTQALLSDGFDSPVGTEAERHSDATWPGAWVDYSPYGESYMGGKAIHTGADLNLPDQSDAHMAAYAVASGTVLYAKNNADWGGLVVIKHDPFVPNGPVVYSRYAHLETITVEAGRRVRRGQQVGTIGQPPKFGAGYHLHFDISETTTLEANAADWPGLNRERVLRDYTDPRVFIRAHRPARA